MSIFKTYGLIGKRLDYSFSKSYFAEKFEKEKLKASYENIEIQNLDLLKKEVAEKNIAGFNVTIPYKKEILNWVDHTTKTVQEIGAANCIQITKNKEWVAHNTDTIGFEASLLKLLEGQRPQALIFGTGGASKAVQFILSKLNLAFQLVSRSNIENGLQYADLSEHILKEYKLLIHTTPLGTYPNIADCIPLPFEHLNDTHYCFDLIYNPEKTSFLTRAEASGARIMNGKEMLKIQAEESWKIWNS